jgi:azurin
VPASVVSGTMIGGVSLPTVVNVTSPQRSRRVASSKRIVSMPRHSLCAVLCTVALTLSPALALAQAPKTAAPKAAAPKAAAPKAAAGAAKAFTLTGSDNMRFTPSVIRVKAGDKVKVTLKVVSAMPKMAMAHNFVLLKAGVNAATVAGDGAMARDTNYVAKKSEPQIIVHSAMVGGGESVTVEFTAPAAGKYQFICTFPAHFQGGMVGQLIVE